MRKWLSCLIVAVLSMVLVPQAAWAHELITDSTNQVGLVLHVEPDDNSTAGVKSNLEFIMQSGDAASATLRINDVVVAPVLEAGVVSASYTFPAQGTYMLHLTVDTKEGAHYSFSHSLEVLRGATTEPSSQRTIVWAVSGLVGSILALALLGGIGWRLRRAIAERSHQH